jgi:hypothetical protein
MTDTTVECARLPSEFEEKLLRDMNGEPQPGLHWGAAMGEALESLKGSGYIECFYGFGGVLEYYLTEKARRFLREKELALLIKDGD